jgi:DNA-directed RNA polymerase subunit RPC12/RpoP
MAKTPKPELTRIYEAKKHDEAVIAFETDKEALRAEGYVPVEETWSEPDREIPGLGSVWRYLTHRRFAEHPELIKVAEREPTNRFHKLEVRYAPVERAARSQGGQLDITVTKNGRCPHCAGPTMLMPRPPYERYCHACEAEFPA